MRDFLPLVIFAQVIWNIAHKQPPEKTWRLMSDECLWGVFFLSWLLCVWLCVSLWWDGNLEMSHNFIWGFRRLEKYSRDSRPSTTLPTFLSLFTKIKISMNTFKCLSFNTFTAARRPGFKVWNFSQLPKSLQRRMLILGDWRSLEDLLIFLLKDGLFINDAWKLAEPPKKISNSTHFVKI